MTAADVTSERKTYRITPAGRRVLRGLRDEVEELYREIALGEEPGGRRRGNGGLR